MTTQHNERARRRAAPGKGSARRDELLTIAAWLFATRGYSQTTVRDIAEEAGILSGSLYHHFHSKEAMLSEILHDFMDGLLARFTELVGQGDVPRESLEALVRLSFRTIHECPHQVALYQNEANLLANLPDFGFVGARSREIENVWVEVLEAGRESGDFRADLESNLVHRFIRDTVWSTVRWYDPDGRFPHATLADQYLALLLDGIRAPAASS